MASFLHNSKRRWCFMLVSGDGHSAHIMVNPAGVRWASVQLGAPWRLPSLQSLIISLHEPGFAAYIYQKDVGKFYFILSDFDKKKNHIMTVFFLLLLSRKSSEREEERRKEILIRQAFQSPLSSLWFNFCFDCRFFFAHSREPGNITEVKPCLVTYALTWKGKRGSEWVKSS